MLSLISLKFDKSKWPTSVVDETRERELKLTLDLTSKVEAVVGQG